jgi:transcriptional regulator with PAS, ATPase and Fis domain
MPVNTADELAASAIHSQSARRDKPYLAINCSAIPESLLESELFGHVKGSFTGAASDKIGLFEAAHHGTLLLDEIGDVSPAIQVKLLRVLQEREIRRVGDNRTRQVDVRLVTATNKDLKQLVASGTVREDFFYRIHVFEIRLPPLRERTEDIPLLVDHFIEELCRKKGRSANGIARDALQLLMGYHWPGNVRQLRNAIEHACVTVSGDRLSYLDLPPELRDPHGVSLPDVQQDLSVEERAEREQIISALRQTGGNRTKAAEILGTSRVTLWKKIGKYTIEVPG